MYRTSLSITIYISTGKSGLFVQYYRVQSIPEIQLAENDSILQINKPFLERDIYPKSVIAPTDFDAFSTLFCS